MACAGDNPPTQWDSIPNLWILYTTFPRSATVYFPCVFSEHCVDISCLHGVFLFFSKAGPGKAPTYSALRAGGGGYTREETGCY